MRLNTNIAQLNKVGNVLEKRLHKLGIQTVYDLIQFFPFRYEDYSAIKKIKELEEGMDVTVQGKIELINTKRSPRKRTLLTEALITDGELQLRIVWFNQAYIAKVLHVGDEVSFSGKVKSDMFGLQMVSPSYERVRDEERGTGDDTLKNVHTARIVPMYHLTAGITHKQLRFLMEQAMEAVDMIDDWIPEDIRDKADIMELKEALRAIHFPESHDELRHAERRLKFDELFVLQLRAEMVRQSVIQFKAPPIAFKEQETKTFVSQLPFELTNDQKIAAWKILQDMARDMPMNRLLEGDVGSGKTVVAAMVLYNAVLNGFQGVMMAPTEILARQHFVSLTKLLGEKVRVGILTRSEFQISDFKFQNTSKAGQKKEMIECIKKGDVDVIVGTHALLVDDVGFKNLGLVIVDEQHRFGVEQRKTIREKSGDDKTVPHFLSMTATPIPRSFALAMYGDLDISMIKQMPAGRKVIQTKLVDPHNREKAYEFIRAQVKEGRQVFVICPLIEESTGGSGKRDEGRGSDTNPLPTVPFPHPSSEKKSVMQEYEKLSKHIFPDLKIDFLHGKLTSKDKDETMKKFADGKTDILVSTSVVEVGVNIPNASVMMIEGAERFGLAQLHQFRGRVGRSSHQSYCFLFTDSDSAKIMERLTLFASTTDGFKLAEYDLKTRGPGDVYGTAQSGLGHMKMATMQDSALIELARDIARDIDFEKYKTLRDRVKEWEQEVHLE